MAPSLQLKGSQPKPLRSPVCILERLDSVDGLSLSIGKLPNQASTDDGLDLRGPPSGRLGEPFDWEAAD